MSCSPAPRRAPASRDSWLCLNHWLHGSGASETRVGQPCLSHCRSATAPGSPCPWCCWYLVMPCPWGGDVLPPPTVCLSHTPRLLSQPFVRREGRVARGGGFIGLAKHTERRANSLGSLRLPGRSVCCPCQIIQPYKYKSSQAQREQDSFWASNSVLERIKAIQSSSLLH